MATPGWPDPLVLDEVDASPQMVPMQRPTRAGLVGGIVQAAVELTVTRFRTMQASQETFLAYFFALVRGLTQCLPTAASPAAWTINLGKTYMMAGRRYTYNPRPSRMNHT